MIPSPTKAFSGEALQGDPLGPQRVSKKKGAKNFSSLFASLLEKARSPKDGAAAASSAPVGPKNEGEALLRQGAEKLKNAAADSRKTGAAAPKERPAEVSARNGTVKAPGDPVDLKNSSAAPSAQTVALKAAPLKDAKAEERADDSSETKASAKLRAADNRKKDRLSESSGAAVAETFAAASAAAAGQTSPKAAAKADAEAKAEERVEGAEGKKKDKRKERLEIEVIDQRRGEAYGASSVGPKNASAGDNGPGDGSAKNGADLVLTLREGSGQGASEASDASRAAPGQKTSFADALSRELRETYNGDIVQRASVVLKDGGDGLIRLSLRPESLGSVKIKLELADNKIAGRILVETEEALKAFGKELRSLEQAFVDGGFDGASLELALSSGDSGAGSGRKDGGDAPRPFFSDRLIASEYDSAVPAADSARRPMGVREDSLIDMLA